MIPWTLLASAKVPNETSELRLMKRGAEYSIMLGQIELMNSRRTRSESALATIAAKALRDRPGPSVLIGGLGMGFTLRAALAELPIDARVTVVELVPEVVAWARGPMVDLFEGCLDDPRISLRVEDVVDHNQGRSSGVRCDPPRCRQRPGGPDPGDQQPAVSRPGIAGRSKGAPSQWGAGSLGIGARRRLFPAFAPCRNSPWTLSRSGAMAHGTSSGSRLAVSGRQKGRRGDVIAPAGATGLPSPHKTGTTTGLPTGDGRRRDPRLDEIPPRSNDAID